MLRFLIIASYNCNMMNCIKLCFILHRFSYKFITVRFLWKHINSLFFIFCWHQNKFQLYLKIDRQYRFENFTIGNKKTVKQTKILFTVF